MSADPFAMVRSTEGAIRGTCDHCGRSGVDVAPKPVHLTRGLWCVDASACIDEWTANRRSVIATPHALKTAEARTEATELAADIMLVVRSLRTDPDFTPAMAAKVLELLATKVGTGKWTPDALNALLGANHA